MATSGTYSFAPSVADLVQNAYGRIQIRRPSLLAEHMTDARIESNLLLAEFDNRGVNLWTVDLQSTLLVQGTATYNVDPTTITILDAYIDTGSGENTVSRIITSISRSDYAAIPDKLQQGLPTVFWYNRQINPTITMWEVPDNNGPYLLKYYRFRQIQDSVLAGGVQPEVPLRWLDAFTAALSARLARIYAPTLLAEAKAEAERTWQIAAQQDTENAGFYIMPGIDSYYRP